MNEARVETIRSIWRNASDQEVFQALGRLDDFEKFAQEVICAEAKKRSLDPPPARLECLEIKSCGRGWVLRVPVLLQHFSVQLLAVSVAPLGIIVIRDVLFAEANWAMRLVLGLLVWPTATCALCFPLTSYGRTLVLSLVAGVAFCVSAMAMQYRQWRFQAPFFLSWWGTALVVILACLFMGGIGLLSVYLRRRYRPIRTPGECNRCGYDLRGLPEARCPECGTPFSKDSVGAVVPNPS